MNKMIKGFIEIERLSTKAEYARSIKKTRGWVTQLAKRNMIETVKIKGGELVLIDIR